jgi:uncharacterized protein
MSLVKLPFMNETEIEMLLGSQYMCRIAFNGDEYPYLAPFRYIKMNGELYFHFTNYGKKMKLIEKDDKVCVQIEYYTPDLSRYSFVSLRGQLKKVENKSELNEAIKRFIETGQELLSPNFLAAHGFNPDEGWDAFNGKNLVIIKLVNIVERVGLKSP